MKKFVLLLVLVVIGLGCISQNSVIIGDQEIDVEIADTVEKQQDGLMYRDELCNDCGMLFVFDNDFYPSFWMKNTLIPLEMIFINSDLVIVDVLEAEPCAEEPCEKYTPQEPAKYVLEVNANRFGDSIIGQKVEII